MVGEGCSLQTRSNYLKGQSKILENNTHKSGIQVPKTVDEAYKIYQQMGTTFCTKSTETEMTNVHVAFKVLNGVTQEQMI